MDYNKLALEMHKKMKGKLEVASKFKIKSQDDLSIAYTPGVAAPCREIALDKGLAYTYTSKSNMVAVVTDGSAVLGMGNIGAAAAIPVMEGKCVLFKEFAGIDAFPICLATQNNEEIIRTVAYLEPVFGGINLEDIEAPRCFEIEHRLKEILNIPIFHDDQHGTAVVTVAALINALKLAGKRFEDVVVVINGSGAAGHSIGKMLLQLKVKNVIMCDRKGILSRSRTDMDPHKQNMANATNNDNLEGSLKEAMAGSDVFIGVSGPDLVTKDMVATMNAKAIVLALANPTPEIMPEEALDGGAFIVGTGRSDYPNQVNNVLAFPGIFRGALDVRASEINEDMKLAAAYALAESVGSKLNTRYILPLPCDDDYTLEVAAAVSSAAVRSGAAKK